MRDEQQNDLHALFPGSESGHEENSRRGFLVTTLPAGFALAVQPVSAQTITTDTQGLEAGEVRIPAKDGFIPAYRALPAKGKNHPVVIVVQEIFGVHEHIKDLCRRLAKAGHFAIAPALYARQGDPASVTDMQALMRDIVSKVPDEQVMSDLDATVAFAAQQGGDSAKLAITGFCWGGRVVWLYSAHNPKVKAGAAWYGRLVGNASPLQPKHPVDIAASLTVPVLGLYGGKDGGIPLDTVEKMREALKAGKSKSEIVVYQDAPHGFNADYRPSYRKADAEAAWARMLSWFKANGAA
ncbi:MAG: dienelactone hydrolase family protein [Bryobacter sp.]